VEALHLGSEVERVLKGGSFILIIQRTLQHHFGEGDGELYRSNGVRKKGSVTRGRVP
jgi:hypothetical protein